MHEFSVAEHVVDHVLDAADTHDVAVVEGITIEVGTATHLNPEQLRCAIDVLAEETIAEGVDVTIEPVSPSGRCSCGWEGSLEEIGDGFAFAPDRTCPDCGAQVDLTQGMECRLVSFSVPDEAEAKP